MTEKGRYVIYAPLLRSLRSPVWPLVYGESGAAVTGVIVNDAVVFEDGQPTRFDTGALLDEADEVGRRLAARARPGLAWMERLEPYLTETYRGFLHEFDIEFSSSSVTLGRLGS